jgi:hypothetical protein
MSGISQLFWLSGSARFISHLWFIWHSSLIIHSVYLCRQIFGSPWDFVVDVGLTPAAPVSYCLPFKLMKSGIAKPFPLHCYLAQTMPQHHVIILFWPVTLRRYGDIDQYAGFPLT